MKLSIGIVGLPNVGKSTLFKIITNQKVNIANYPFSTIDPNIGVVAVPDERLQRLATVSRSKEIIPAIIEFYNIAGLVKGANRGEGLGNQFLSHIRQTQAIVIVIRVFKNQEIVHVENTVDPLRDFQIINTELILKDLETVEKRLKSLESEAKSGDKKAIKNLAILKNIEEELNNGNLIVKFREEEIVKEMQLLTAKKQIYLLNGKKEEVPKKLVEEIEKLDAEYLVCDLAEARAVPELIKKAYVILDLISFFTTGEKETRAWTVKKGTLAPMAAGGIFSDF